MHEFLEKKWKHIVNYNCVHCLQEAYHSEINDIQGYVVKQQ